MFLVLGCTRYKRLSSRGLLNDTTHFILVTFLPITISLLPSFMPKSPTFRAPSCNVLPVKVVHDAQQQTRSVDGKSSQ